MALRSVIPSEALVHLTSGHFMKKGFPSVLGATTSVVHLYGVESLDAEGDVLVPITHIDLFGQIAQIGSLHRPDQEIDLPLVLLKSGQLAVLKYTQGRLRVLCWIIALDDAPDDPSLFLAIHSHHVAVGSFYGRIALLHFPAAFPLSLAIVASCEHLGAFFEKFDSPGRKEDARIVSLHLSGEPYWPAAAREKKEKEDEDVSFLLWVNTSCIVDIAIYPTKSYCAHFTYVAAVNWPLESESNDSPHPKLTWCFNYVDGRAVPMVCGAAAATSSTGLYSSIFSGRTTHDGEESSKIFWVDKKMNCLSSFCIETAPVMIGLWNRVIGSSATTPLGMTCCFWEVSSIGKGPVLVFASPCGKLFRLLFDESHADDADDSSSPPSEMQACFRNEVFMIKNGDWKGCRTAVECGLVKGEVVAMVPLENGGRVVCLTDDHALVLLRLETDDNDDKNNETYRFVHCVQGAGHLTACTKTYKDDSPLLAVRAGSKLNKCVKETDSDTTDAAEAAAMDVSVTGASAYGATGALVSIHTRCVLEKMFESEAGEAEGTTALWPLKRSLSDVHDAAVLLASSTNARVLAIEGEVFTDISDALPLAADEETLAAGTLGCEDWIAQVTPTFVRAFHLTTPSSSSSTKSSTTNNLSFLEWRPPEGSSISSALVSAGLILLQCTHHGHHRMLALTLLRGKNYQEKSEEKEEDNEEEEMQEGNCGLFEISGLDMPREISCIGNVMRSADLSSAVVAVGTYAPSVLILKLSFPTTSGGGGGSWMVVGEETINTAEPDRCCPTTHASEDQLQQQQQQTWTVGSPLAAARHPRRDRAGAALPSSVFAVPKQGPTGAALQLWVSTRDGHVHLLHMTLDQHTQQWISSTARLHPRSIPFSRLSPTLCALPQLQRVAPGYTVLAIAERLSLLRQGSEEGGASIEELPLLLSEDSRGTPLVLQTSSGGCRLYLFAVSVDGSVSLSSLEAHQRSKIISYPLSIVPDAIATHKELPGLVAIAGRSFPADGTTLSAPAIVVFDMTARRQQQQGMYIDSEFVGEKITSLAVVPPRSFTTTHTGEYLEKAVRYSHSTCIILAASTLTEDDVPGNQYRGRFQSFTCDVREQSKDEGCIIAPLVRLNFFQPVTSLDVWENDDWLTGVDFHSHVLTLFLGVGCRLAVLHMYPGSVVRQGYVGVNAEIQSITVDAAVFAGAEKKDDEGHATMMDESLSQPSQAQKERGVPSATFPTECLLYLASAEGVNVYMYYSKRLHDKMELVLHDPVARRSVSALRIGQQIVSLDAAGGVALLSADIVLPTLKVLLDLLDEVDGDRVSGVLRQGRLQMNMGDPGLGLLAHESSSQEGRAMVVTRGGAVSEIFWSTTMEPRYVYDVQHVMLNSPSLAELLLSYSQELHLYGRVDPVTCRPAFEIFSHPFIAVDEECEVKSTEDVTMSTAEEPETPAVVVEPGEMKELLSEVIRLNGGGGANDIFVEETEKEEEVLDWERNVVHGEILKLFLDAPQHFQQQVVATVRQERGWCAASDSADLVDSEAAQAGTAVSDIFRVLRLFE